MSTDHANFERTLKQQHKMCQLTEGRITTTPHVHPPTNGTVFTPEGNDEQIANVQLNCKCLQLLCCCELHNKAVCHLKFTLMMQDLGLSQRQSGVFKYSRMWHYVTGAAVPYI